MELSRQPAWSVYRNRLLPLGQDQKNACNRLLLIVLIYRTARALDFGGCLLVGITSTSDVGHCLLVGIVRSTDFGIGVFNGNARSMDFGSCLRRGIVRTTHVLVDLQGIVY